MRRLPAATLADAGGTSGPIQDRDRLHREPVPQPACGARPPPRDARPSSRRAVSRRPRPRRGRSVARGARRCARARAGPIRPPNMRADARAARRSGPRARLRARTRRTSGRGRKGAARANVHASGARRPARIRPRARSARSSGASPRGRCCGCVDAAGSASDAHTGARRPARKACRGFSTDGRGRERPQRALGREAVRHGKHVDGGRRVRYSTVEPERTTAASVFRTILRSSQAEQFSMYQLSHSTRSASDVLPRNPFTCAQPVMPDFTR